MYALQEAARPRRSPRAAFIAVGLVLVAAFVTGLSFMAMDGASEGSRAIDQVKAAVDPAVATQRSQVEAKGGTFSVSWSATPMTGGQMVEATIRSSVASLAGRPVFMVDRTGTIIPQDQRAASLIGAGATPQPHR